ncbi:zinc finger protein 462 isoform X2 [Spea bombifrons]|uniref:zinc finger protein 462 isoform X2 n=1 Tax=Spea bombifrons TaxID=233779 RepID=UPI00234B952A|nr:zinc finger protein 462 isoform X2 [Spea bombifrons]
MEVLQCDGCDFRAQSYDELKAHIQDVHTAFLQPTDVTEEGSSQTRSVGTNSSNQSEGVFSSVKDEFVATEETHDQGVPQVQTSYYGHNATLFGQSAIGSSKPTNKFFQCKFCVRYFRSKNLLVEHTRKVHGHGANSTPGSMNYNIMMHDGFGKVFSCQFCTYKSPRRARIIKHQKMYHKNSLKETSPTTSQAVPVTVQETYKELPAEVVERSILESMVKPLTKSRGNFCCEWCSYQTPRRERWCDHMMKKHRGMVKILSSLRQDGMNMSELQNKTSLGSSPSTSFMPLNLGSHDLPNANVQSYRSPVNNVLPRGGAPKYPPMSYVPIKPKPSPNTGLMNMSDRSPYGFSDKSNVPPEMDDTAMLNDSSSDEEYIELDSENGLSSLDHHGSGMSGEPLLGSENNKLLETKGIPFRRYMNRFQCPFCPFLTMHRRSISRHIENIHLSGKTAVYKCDECPFSCKSPLRLGAHKQCHSGASPEWDTLGTFNDSMPSSLNESFDSSNINGRKSIFMTDSTQQYPYKCTMCSYSTTTLKGLRVHQQHKHSFCDNMPKSDSNMVRQTQESEPDSNSNMVRKSQTSILGLSSKNNFVAKASRKSSTDFPLDLSPGKKRTRIDEIASNLQSKINQSKQQEEDSVINVEDDEEENEVEIEVELDKEDDMSEPIMESENAYTLQQIWNKDANSTQKSMNFRNIQQNYSASNGAEIELTLSDDDDDYYYQSVVLKDQDSHALVSNQSGLFGENDQLNESSEYNEESGRLYYCKHCDFSNKSARSVSTHYQRMHPYIKFSFRYILDPNDHSAVYRCLECYIDYNNFDDLQQHYAEHHPEAMNVLNFDQSDLIYRCRFCSYTSPNVRSLMPHYQRMHPTVKINNAMIFSSYVVERQDELSSESQTLREILNSAPKSMATSTPSGQGASTTASLNKNATKSFASENENQKAPPSVNNVVVYDCDVCNFASPNMHSVLVHYQKKHPDEKASYFRIQKTMRIVSVDSGSAMSQLAFDGGSSITPSPSNVTTPNQEFNAEIYFCKHCSYTNRSVVGVLVHYQKRHPEIKVTAKYIRQAPPTAAGMINSDSQQSTHSTKPATTQNAKKSTLQPRENEMFFCQHCDYGNQTVKGVLIHYQKKHRDFKVNADVIRQHTAAIRSLCDQGQKKLDTNTNLAPSAADNEKTKLRSLRCRQCSYSTPYVYALRKHMKKDHPNLKATVTSILKWAFLDGFIEAGYHCEWCIYSHPEPSGLLEHYQRRHPEHYVDYTYMATKLCAGPENVAQAASDSKSYKCRDCSFEGPSIWDITNHYQAFHPWALKGDESILLDIIKEKDASDKANAEDSILSHIQSIQNPVTNTEPQLDSGDESNLLQEKSLQSTGHSALSSSPYQCAVCQSEYNNLHGLLTHYGKKHPGMKVKAADFAQDTDINHGAVYKCRHCPYINTRIHGVLTHYQKRHPTIKVTAEDFVHDVEPPSEMSQNDAEEHNRIFKQGYGAYRCKICPYFHGTLEKLKIHYEKYHDQPEPDILSQSSPRDSCSGDPETLSDDQPPQTVVTLEPGEVPDEASFKHNHVPSHTVFRCQLCKYFCSTRKGIARHYRIKHNNVRAQPEGKNNLFKCALCAYTNPIRKGLAAHYQKRHDIDAYYTHCLAASRTVTDKPNKVIIPTPPKDDSPELSDELKKAVERKKCSLCPFQSFSKKGIVSHYMKRHPGVIPKKQNASKLGCYFTAVYAEENECQSSGEDKLEPEAPVVEEPEPPEPELLPFRCIKCFKLSFSTPELLCMHYTDHHSKDIKRDFSVLGTTGTRSSTTTYQCKHCGSKLNSVTELTLHLNSHIEDFQKRAKRQERRKQLMNKQKSTETALADGKPDKTGQEGLPKPQKEKVVVGYKCKFCVEVHPTLRAICNHLRKHVQYGNVPPDFKDDEDDITDMNDDVDKEPDSSNASVAEGAVEGEAKEPNQEEQSRPGGYPCTQCDRVLMSMQGLRSHERSHLALALFTREDKYSCQFCSFVSAFRHNLDRHIQTHHGHHKPFRCKLCPFKSSYNSRLKTHIIKAHGGDHAYKCSSCPFSTMTISLLKDHSLKVHGKMLTLPRLRTIVQTIPRAKQSSRIGKETESLYSEPPDVQQQLNHYQSAALAKNNSNNSPVPLPVVNTSAELKQEAVLNCEFCEFSSGYIQSIRRHYRDKHGGKKLFKCKDCTFYTCFKSAFTMHVEAGHSGTPKEGPKDLRCPFCLYHTKYKHNMIDHIVLHREERVVPIEVCRSKLSKQLQGVVFRCDKCTFTCSSDESLQQHIEKHNELKPYKCQLCYYESKQSEELDSHLREEHKVSRNFELVGLVNLDQLEQMKDKTDTSSSDEEETGFKSEDTVPFPDNKVATPEKRFRCEFCGRTFTQDSEWERHVLRHGMTISENPKEIEETRKQEDNVEESQMDYVNKVEKTEERLGDYCQQTKTSSFKNLTISEKVETKKE